MYMGSEKSGVSNIVSFERKAFYLHFCFSISYLENLLFKRVDTILHSYFVPLFKKLLSKKFYNLNPDCLQTLTVLCILKCIALNLKRSLRGVFRFRKTSGADQRTE